MRRLLCLLAVMLFAVSPAWAEETAAAWEDQQDQREPDLLEIWLTEDGDRTWLTSAPQAFDGLALTSPALLPEKTDGLTVSDGVNEWKVRAVIPDSTGLMAMLFFDPETSLPRSRYWPVMSFGESVQADSCVVRYGNEDGSRVDCRVRSAASVEWKGARLMLLDLEEEVRPGTPVLNANDELVGLVVAEYAEGRRRALAMPVEEIVRGMTEATALLNDLVAWGTPPEGYRVTAEKNTVTFDWSGMTLPEKGEDEELCLVVADLANDYLNYYPAETEDRTLTLLLTPGRVYISGILASEGAPAELPEHYEVTVIPTAEPLTEFSFHPTLTAVAEMPEGAEEEQAPALVTEVTETLLRSGRAYFYSASSYAVDEVIQDRTLLVTLTDPEGNNYRYESAWMYAPDYMNEDVWYLPLTGTGLTYSLDLNGYPEGEYHLAYYVNGYLADTVSFELKGQ